MEHIMGMAGLLTGMLEAHPQRGPASPGDLAEIIEAMQSCAANCIVCADACIGEQEVAHLVRCIRFNLTCADICATTANALSRFGRHEQVLMQPLLEACAVACRSCGSECERHSRMHEHCRICADTCRHCEQLCRQLL